jgi:hypothetical protein
MPAAATAGAAQRYRQALGLAGDAIMTGPGTNIWAFGAAPSAKPGHHPERTFSE